MNYNTHIAQYHTNNGIWSVNRKIPGEIFFFKNYAENKTEKLVPDHFLFFKKLYIR